MLAWTAVGVAVRGAAHVRDGQPCQDAVSWAASGPWLVAAVCDGAGSAPHAEIGATVGAQAFVDAVLSACRDRDDLDAASGTALARTAVEAARAAVASALPRGGSLADAHATLVAVAATPRGGVLIHIGDGTGAVRTAGSAVMSPPENGAFANETYFFTEAGWADRLRVTAFSAPRTVLLLSDGAAAVALGPDGAPLPAFLDPVSAYLASVPEAEGREALAATLAPARTGHLTDDDLGVFWAVPASS
ncbi:MAG: PP2C family serine/threonine-protein phosphatase [Bacteroidota bacterium]